MTATQTAHMVRYFFLDSWEDAWLPSHEEVYPSYEEALSAARNWDGTVCPCDNPISAIDWEIVPV